MAFAISFNTFGQLVKTNPGVFTAEDEVTFTIDATASTDDRLVGYTGDVWAWVFISSGCPADCDAPTNVNPAGQPDTEAARMTRSPDNPNVYSITFVPTEFLNKPPGEIQEIGFVLKSRDWGDGIQTQDFTVNVTPLEFVPNPNRTFPSKFTQLDVVTVFFDQSLLEGEPAVAELDEVYMYMFADIVKEDGTFVESVEKVSWPEVGNTEDLKMTVRDANLFSLTFIPSSFLPLDQGDEIVNIKYIFRNAEGTVQSDTYEIIPLSLD